MIDRKHGYLEALRECGIPIRTELIKCHHISSNSGLSDTHELLLDQINGDDSVQHVVVKARLELRDSTKKT